MDPRVELAQTLLFQGAWTRTARPHKSHQALQSSHKEDRAHSPATRPAGPTPSSQLFCTLGTLSLGRAAARAAHQRPHRSTGTAGDRHTDTRAHRCTQGLIDTWTHVDTHVDTDTWTQTRGHRYVDTHGHTRRRIGGRTHRHTWTHRHVGSRFPWAVTQPKPSLAAGPGEVQGPRSQQPGAPTPAPARSGGEIQAVCLVTFQSAQGHCETAFAWGARACPAPPPGLSQAGNWPGLKVNTVHPGSPGPWT